MSIEVGLLSEASVTERALERLLLVVNVSYVPLEVRRYAEGSVAVLALVGLLTRMGSQVTSQIRRPWENLTTELARVFLLVPLGLQEVVSSGMDLRLATDILWD